MNGPIIALNESYEILVYLCKFVSKLPKDFKYSIWEKMENFSLDTVAEISLTTKAFWFEEKIQHLKQAKKNIELTYILLRLCHDSWKLSHNDFGNIWEKLNNLLNQVSKRENFCNSKLKEQKILKNN